MFCESVGLESLLQYELEKLKVCNRSTCVYRDYSGGVELQCMPKKNWMIVSGQRAVLAHDVLLSNHWLISAVDLTIRECSNAYWHVYRVQSSRNRKRDIGASLG